MVKSDFEIKIKNKEISQPTQKTFTLKKWQDGFDSIVDKTERDKSLLIAGRWIFDRLERIRQKVHKLSLPLPKEKLARLHIGYTNRIYHVVKLNSMLEKSTSGEIILGAQIIQAKIPINAQGEDLSPDAILTSSIDGVIFPLIAVLNSCGEKERTVKIDPMQLLTNEKLLMSLGNYYSSFEETWREILWNKYDFDTINNTIHIRPNNTFYDQARAVSDYRRQDILQQEISQAGYIWNNNLASSRKLELSRRVVINIKSSGKKRDIAVTYDNTVKHLPPYPVIARLLSQKEYLKDLLTADLPSLPGINIFLLLDSWDVLGAYVKSLTSNFPSNTGVYAIGTIYNYSPSILKKDLIQLFIKTCRIEREVAELLVDFLTFDPKGTDDLWSSPLIRLGDKLLPLISPILSGNLIRIIELWLKRGGVDLGKRGGLFESYVRKEIQQSINSAPIFKNSGCHSTSLKLGINKEEIDILFYIGNKILVGEAKCSLYPTDAIEYHNVFHTFEYAAEQAKRKSAKVIECISEVKDKIIGLKELNIDNINVIPFIITNNTLGVGYSVDGVPIVDLYILNKYFDGKLEKYVLFGYDGTKKVGKNIIFYTTEDEAEKYIEEYLNNPPQIDMYKQSFKYESYPYVKFEENELQAIFSRLIVEFPVPELFRE